MADFPIDVRVRGWCIDVLRVYSELDIDSADEEPLSAWGLDDWYIALYRRTQIDIQLGEAGAAASPELECADALLRSYTREVPASWAPARGMGHAEVTYRHWWWSRLPSRGPVFRDYLRQGEKLTE